MARKLMVKMTRMAKTDGENGKSGPKNVKVAQRKCESGPTENRYARGGLCMCKQSLRLRRDKIGA